MRRTTPQTDEFLTLNQARDLVPGRPDLSTLYRWATRGVRGVVLRTVPGAKLLTTAAWVEEFLEQRAAGLSAPVPTAPRVATPRSHRRRAALVHARLAERLGLPQSVRGNA